MRLLAALAVVAFVWAGIYLPGLGTGELKGEEARRVLPGRTMMQTGDWIVPRSAGRTYNRKPPGVNWATAAAVKLTGRMDEWAVRLPSVLGILALALVMAGALRGLLGAEGALLAALITLTNIGFIEKGRLAEIEALYCACFGIAIVAWIALWWGGRRLAAWCVALVALGIGFLVKGPPHVWYFYAVVIAVLREEKQTRELRNWRHLLGLALFFATWSWWALLNSARNPRKDSGAVWTEQITHRLGFAEFDFSDWLLQIPQSLVNFLPWALLLPLVWRVPVAGRWFPAAEAPGDARRAALLAGIKKGIVPAFLVIALLPSSRPRFMLPLNSVAAILVAAAVMARPAEWRRKARPWIIGAVAAAILSVGAYAGLLAGGVIRREELRPFAREITRRTGAEAEVILFRVPERMWPFYLGLRCREIAELEELPPRARWIMMPAKDRESSLPLLAHRFGKPVGETLLKEPLTDDAGGKGWEFVLLEFAP